MNLRNVKRVVNLKPGYDLLGLKKHEGAYHANYGSAPEFNFATASSDAHETSNDSIAQRMDIELVELALLYHFFSLHYIVPLRL